MLGHVYVVEDARDLAQIVRDVTRYGGAYRPEVRCIFAVFTCGFDSNLVSTIRRMSTSSSKDGPIGKRLKRWLTRRCTISVSKKTVFCVNS